MLPTIVIRPAQVSDCMDIWRLLHSEGRHIAMEELVENADDYVVLLRDEKLLGLYRSPRSVAVHPLCSQTLVEDVMLKTVRGLLGA